MPPYLFTRLGHLLDLLKTTPHSLVSTSEPSEWKMLSDLSELTIQSKLHFCCKDFSVVQGDKGSSASKALVSCATQLSLNAEHLLFLASQHECSVILLAFCVLGARGRPQGHSVCPGRPRKATERSCDLSRKMDSVYGELSSSVIHTVLTFLLHMVPCV